MFSTPKRIVSTKCCSLLDNRTLLGFYPFSSQSKESTSLWSKSSSIGCRGSNGADILWLCIARIKIFFIPTSRRISRQDTAQFMFWGHSLAHIFRFQDCNIAGRKKILYIHTFLRDFKLQFIFFPYSWDRNPKKCILA